jgi:tetraprenyl-beta-curcumene synthase
LPLGRATLSPRQLAVLAGASARELLWGLRAVSREVARWRALAATIPDERLRDDALRAIQHKRTNIDGAALFSTLPRRRDPNLLRLLVAYEILADFLDCAGERGAHVGVANGLHLYRALRDALDPAAPIGNYYRYHPWSEDGGYLLQLVATCRRTCGHLPSFQTVRPLVAHAASLTDVLALNHEPHRLSRDATLRAWAKRHFPGRSELAWFEWCGAASAWLAILALLALAADEAYGAPEAGAVYAAYLPWVSLAGTMLDSYVDVEEDAAADAHSYIAHYPSRQASTERVIAILGRSLQELATLRDGHRHLVIIGCMVAMYLSEDSGRVPAMRASTDKLRGASGDLGCALVPVLRAWRIIYRQTSV